MTCVTVRDSSATTTYFTCVRQKNRSRHHLYRVGVWDPLDSCRESCTQNPQTFYAETADRMAQCTLRMDFIPRVGTPRSTRLIG